MSTQPAQETKAVTTKTCSNCKLSVAQPRGTRRTLCPGCGAFYDAGVANQVRAQQNGMLRHTQEDQLRDRYTKVHREKAKDYKSEESSGGALQSIANFFQNIGPKKKSDKKKQESVTLPDIEQNRSLTSASNGHSPRPPSTPRDGQTAESSRRFKDRPVEQVYTCDQIRDMYKTAKETQDWSELESVYSTMFSSFSQVNTIFKKGPKTAEYSTISDSGIKMDLVETVYEILKKASTEIQKSVLKQVIGCLLSDKGLGESTKARVNVGPNELRTYIIFTLNPLFQNCTTFVIFAHLLRQISSLTDHGHHMMVHWYRKISTDQFRSLVLKLNNFISNRLYPANPADLPPISKCQWWIPSCCKVMSLLNVANGLQEPSLIPHTDFYNETLDNADLFREYTNWQDPSQSSSFSFCQYPFLLTISAKRFILQKDSEQQMINQARKTIVAQVQSKQAPELQALFLNLKVRRRNLVADSLNEIAKNKYELKKKLKVTFLGEPGLDLGGLTKEWFLLLVRQLFRPEYGMFVLNTTSDTYWFSVQNKDSKMKEFNLAGVLMGLAVYNGINLDIKLPYVAYKKLLSPAVVPCNNPNATVGVLADPTVHDLESFMPDVASSLKEVMEYEGDLEDDLCLTFQASIGQNNRVITEELKKDGAEIPVTKKNRQEYVKLYLEWVLNKSVYQAFRAFYHGFHSVCASNALLTLKPIEVEILVCGSPNIDMEELRKVCQYDGYHDKDHNIREFWEIMNKLNLKGQRSVLRFVTGSDRIPAGGMKDMEFKISRSNNPKMLPVAHTCFNQLVLPTYNNKKLMQQKLLMAITNTEGFGLE